MNLTIDMLDQIEREAISAPAPMLRLRIAQVRLDLASASKEAKEYAAVLLLKLEHRLRGETVSETVPPTTPIYLAPRLALVENEPAAA